LKATLLLNIYTAIIIIGVRLTRLIVI